MATIHAGDLVTVRCSGEVKGIQTTDDVTAQVSAALNDAGWQVRSIVVSTPSLYNLVTGAWLHYLYTATIVLVAGWDDDTSAAADAVTAAIVQVTGINPTGVEPSVGASDHDSHPIGQEVPSLSAALPKLPELPSVWAITALVAVIAVGAVLVLGAGARAA